MWDRPVYFHQYLNHYGLTNDIYKAIQSEDSSDVVITALNVLKKTGVMPSVTKDGKSESKSNKYRNAGNGAFRNRDYQKALELYNKALSYAPNLSNSMKLAYSNRSALLFRTQCYSACLHDINTCISMGCPQEISEKLSKRRQEAKDREFIEFLENPRSNTFCEEFFQLNIQRNPQIPCASTDIGVMIESQVPKIVATTDIPVGKVLALETAFVSHTVEPNYYFTCYYCQKMQLNLIPCEGCCFALFCNEQCKRNCIKDYHGIECQIMELFETVNCSLAHRLLVKTIVKMKQMSNSWADMIAASQSLGIERIKKSSINEIFDMNYVYSPLTFQNDRPFVYGNIYNAAFSCAITLYHLNTIPSFFPEASFDKEKAMKAIARMMMYLTINAKYSQIVQATRIKTEDRADLNNLANFGNYSLIGKLQNSCSPNVLMVGVNEKLALVSLLPIKRGTELTISYMGYWLDDKNHRSLRNRNLFALYGTVCNCFVCNGREIPYEKYELKEKQKKCLRKLDLNNLKERINIDILKEAYSKLCKALAVFSDIPHSKEYIDIYLLFRTCILYVQSIATANIVLENKR